MPLVAVENREIGTGHRDLEVIRPIAVFEYRQGPAVGLRGGVETPGEVVEGSQCVQVASDIWMIGAEPFGSQRQALLGEGDPAGEVAP